MLISAAYSSPTTCLTPFMNETSINGGREMEGNEDKISGRAQWEAGQAIFASSAMCAGVTSDSF